MATPTAIVGYLALFAAVGFLFVFVNLLVGRLVRPADPNAEKLEIYECGEPTIGSSFVQFDLRFYVVALVFLVFDVEVAFLFPLATVFGKASQLADGRLQVTAADVGAGGTVVLSDDAARLHRELGLAPTVEADATESLRSGAAALTRAAMWAMLVFFVILLIGFAYEWKTGAFDWVRVLRAERSDTVPRSPPIEEVTEQTVYSA